MGKFSFYRSSRPEVFCKEGVLKNERLRDWETLAQVLSFDFVEFLRSAFLIEHLWWLLLFLSKGRDELDAITAKLWVNTFHIKLTQMKFCCCLEFAFVITENIQKQPPEVFYNKRCS